MKKNSKLTIYLFAISLILGLNLVNTFAQTIDILSVDATKYPKMKAEISIKDATNTELRTFSNTDFKITDGGKARAMDNVFCSPDVKKFSMVITIDNTASMQFNPSDVNGSNTNPPLKRTIAVNSAVKLVDALPIDRSECALTSFGSGNPGTVQIKFFTTDKDSLKKEINKIAYAGGTDINTGFLGKNGNRGAINVAAFGRWKPIIVFITDGLHDPQFTSPKGVALKNGEIVNEANKINASIFMVGLGVSLSGEMQSIATGTGGQVFNNLTDQIQLDKALGEILKLAQKDGDLAPCEIEWTTDCSGGNLEIEYQQGAKPKDTFTYSLIPETLPILAANPVNPNTILNVPIGSSQLIDVELEALQNDLTITGDNSTLPQFKVANWGGALPLKLTKGTKKVIKIEYKPTDILCNEAVVSFVSDACTIASINMKGGTVKIEDINVGFATKNVPKNGTFTQKFCNNSCADIEITGFEINGADKAEFKINTAPKIVKSGECLDIDVTYTPSDVKASAALYTIKTKSNNDFTANLIGTGSGLAEIQANDVTFEAIKCGELDKTVTITNNGAIPLNISKIELSNTDDFSIVSGSSITSVAPSSSEIVTVKFKPTTGTGPNYNTDLTIVNDSDNDKNKVVKLTASKFVINFNTNAGTEIDFGLLCPGETVTRDVEISNLSNTTLELTGSMVNGTGFSISKGSWSIPENGKEMVTITFTANADNNYTGTWTLLDDCGAKTINYDLKAQIIAPVLTAPSTNFAATAGSFEEKVIKVTNPTGRDITFDLVSDNIQYTIITPNPATGIILPKNSFIDVTVRFSPIQGEPANGKLNVTTSNNCNYTTAFNLIGDPKFASAILSVDTTKGLIGDKITIPVKLRNKDQVQSSGAKTIQLGLELDANLLEPTGTTPIGTINGNKRRIVITMNLDGTNSDQDYPLDFLIKDAGAAITETNIEFYNPPIVDNDAIAITTYNGKFTLVIGKAEAKIFEKEARPGEVIDFPIYIRDKDKYLQNFHKGIKTYLIYNATVLEPIGLTPSIVNGDQSKGQIEITQLMNFTEVRKNGNGSLLAPETDDVLLTTVKFRAMLGNEVVSKIFIVNSTTIEGKIEISPDSTNFSLLGVCTDLDGSVRLINPFLTPASIDISPNPAYTAIKVKVTALEPGYHTIKVYDLVGHLVGELLSKNIAAGDYEFMLDNTNLDAGNYMVIFDTPTQSFTKTINVVK